MQVPPYVPQPIEILGNVAEEKYLMRVAFVKRVILLHFCTLLGIAALALVPLPRVGLFTSGAATLVALLLLSLARGVSKGRPKELQSSALLAPLVVACFAWFFRELNGHGFPIALFLCGPTAVVLYALLCGRDLSFLGMYLLSLIGSTTALAVASLVNTIGPVPTGEVLIANAAYLTYFVYDLAALLTRRRIGEEIGAVMDLYRDVLNMFSYPFRVWQHWRKHRIWSVRS